MLWVSDVINQFVPKTDSVNDLARTFLRDGKLMQLVALLLVAQEEVMVPLNTGRTIRQGAMDLLDTLNFEEGVDHEQDQYKSLLFDACKLLDVFERAGDALDSYSKTMCGHVCSGTFSTFFSTYVYYYLPLVLSSIIFLSDHIPVDKVLVDVVTILKKAGFSLQVMDIDLRDCYRGRPELWNDKLFNLLGKTQISVIYDNMGHMTLYLGGMSKINALIAEHDDLKEEKEKVEKQAKKASSSAKTALTEAEAKVTQLQAEKKELEEEVSSSRKGLVQKILEAKQAYRNKVAEAWEVAYAGSSFGHLSRAIDWVDMKGLAEAAGRSPPPYPSDTEDEGGEEEEGENEGQEDDDDGAET